MDIIANDMKSIENSIARYIFKKYIMPITTLTNAQTTIEDNDIADTVVNDAVADSESISGDVIDNVTDNEMAADSEMAVDSEMAADNEMAAVVCNEKGSIARIDTKLYKIYLQKIFDLERHSFRILQDDVLKEDLKQMSLADKAYEACCGKNYNINDYKSLPDILRCTYIRKYKHRYYRCKNKVISDDDDVCKKHENCENIYLDNYNTILEQS
jgi:hypothetical protein